MKRFALTAAAGLLLALPAFAPDPVEGQWKTQPDDNGNFGVVEIAPCGERLCGTLLQGYDANGRPVASDNIGRFIIRDMAAEGGGAYGGGTIWAPDRDQTYRSRMELSGDRLQVSGCVLGGLVCRNQNWQRHR